MEPHGTAVTIEWSSSAWSRRDGAVGSPLRDLELTSDAVEAPGAATVVMPTSTDPT